MAKQKQLRAAGYARTSGEGQRDNTSIPNQKDAIERKAEAERWAFTRHYVDEARSGAKIAGREAFQALMRDAALGKFDVVVVYKIDRYARDGTDILDSARTLKRDFGVDVIDASGIFDTRDPNKTLMNFLGAGIAQQERLTILQRTITGKMRKAQEGKPWCGTLPVGRGYDEAKGGWYINDLGHTIRTVLQRYVDGDIGMAAAAEGSGITNAARRLSKWLKSGQLAGTYVAHFRAPDIGIDEAIEIPAVPAVLPIRLLRRAQAKALHNRTWNRHDTRSYRLTGFVYCRRCGRALGGITHREDRGQPYWYRHHPDAPKCAFASVPGRRLEGAVLDALFTFVRDERRFQSALAAAMPTAGDRRAAEGERNRAAKRAGKAQARLDRLVDALLDGKIDKAILIEKQDKLKTERDAAQARLEELDAQLAAMPTAGEFEANAALARLDVEQWLRMQDWRDLPHEDIRRFLHYLFGENPKASGTGIFIEKTADGSIAIELRGAIDLGLLARGYRPGALESEEFEKVKETYQRWQEVKGSKERLEAILASINQSTTT
jgi:site-specific DNA recombinase